jgi:hypothetical protein
VGFKRKPPRFLSAGDVVEVSIDGIGTISNPVVEEPNGRGARDDDALGSRLEAVPPSGAR